MSQPPPYSPSHSFVSDSATLPNFPGQALDIEFNNISAVTGAIEADLSLIQRDDGALGNGVVTFDSLAPSLQTAGLAGATAWQTGVSYVVQSAVVANEKLYRCLIAHVSGVFSADLAAGDWQFVAGIGNVVGPVTSVVGNLPKFHDTIGTILDDSGVPLASLAPLASPALTGAPTAPTPSANDNSTKISTTAYLDGKLAVANGIATLDGSGKLLIAQTPAALVGALVFQGTWNASTNTPTLASGVGTKGFYYKVSVAGSTTIDTINQWNVGDTIVFDGTVWDKIDGIANEVISVAGRTGAVTLTVADVSGGVLRLPNPTNLFVATTGNDSTNTGLSSGSAFLTLQHAVNVALSTYDFQGSNLIINIGTGTFAGATISGPCPGGGGAAALVILGNGSTNTIISSTINVNEYANVQIGSFKVTVASGSNILVQNYSTVTLADGGMNFGAAVTAIVDAVNFSSFKGNSNFGFTISGGAAAAFLISTNSSVQLSVGATYTITGTPAFPNGFVNAIDGSGFNPGITSVFSGSATGPTYNLAINGWVDMEQNVNPLPGNSGGLLAYGSSYDGVPAANAIGVGQFLLTLTGGLQINPQSSGIATWNAGTLAGVANGQLPGTATNDNASAGNIGEYIESKATNGTATVTITNASPGVISWTGHGLNIGSPVNFTTTGGLPTGLTVGVNYYVCSTSFGVNSFTVATSVANALAGTPVNTSSAGSGTHTAISNVVQATSTAVNVTGISLTAGDWDVEFDAQFTGGTTTTVTSFGASVSLSSATIDTTNGRTDGRYTSASAIYNGFALGVFPSARTGALRFSLNATTTIFSVVESTFGTSTSAAFGLMRARRVR